jgi:S-adenosylmethionine:diacylglycerol 3-amino-3-carboxypropyl transferase
MRGNADTVWSRLDGVLFGRMHEDPEIELRAFEPAVGQASRPAVFAIASAGCTARVLAAAGYRVTAVDINPRQLAYARSRAEGGALVEGAAERLAAWGRRSLALAGWTPARVRHFLDLEDTEDQAAYWRGALDTARWRVAMDAALSRVVLGWFYAGALTDALPRRFGRCVRRRLARGCATHPNRTNPYLRGLLRGDMPPEPGPARHAIQWVCADAAGYLESCPPGSFDGFTLSNIGDGASADYLERLWTAVRRASAPGAISIMRSFGEPLSAEEERWAAQDRTAIWGSVHVSA